MATMRFISENGNRISFDSSAKEAICRAFGYRQPSFELRNDRMDRDMRTWDVHARDTDKGAVHKVGILQYYAPAWPGGESRLFPAYK